MTTNVTNIERQAAMWAEQARKIDAWSAEWWLVRPDVARYSGNGALCFDSFVGMARLTNWDGNLVLRCHTRDWQDCIISAQFRLPVMVDRDQIGRRIVDLSCLLPQASRSFIVIADDRLPIGHCQLETPDGIVLVVGRE